MTTSEVDIYNKACSAVTTTSRIASTDEDSTEAKECALWFPSVRDLVLGSAMWQSTTQTARLALLSTRDDDEDWAAGDPLPTFTYAYARPSDMLRPRYLSTYLQFTLAMRGTTSALMTNQNAALLVYTMRQTNIALWDTDLEMAVVHTLAAKIARKLTGSRTKALDNFNLANDMILAARANARNQLQTNLDFAPSAMIARGASNLGPQSPYIYPNADFVMSGFGNVG